MLTSVKLQNFQAHQKTEVRFGPHVNCIIGPNESGKSSIINALEWVLLNHGVTKALIKHGAKFARVEAVLNDHVITRRSGDVNLYKLDGEKKKAIHKGEVPESIQQIVNLSDSSFHDQLDRPFWFDLTAGQLSKEVNRIVSLEAIDTTVASINQRVNKLRYQVEVAREIVKKAKQEKKDLKWVIECEAQVNRVISLQNQLARVQTKRDKVLELAGNLAQKRRTRKEVAKRLEILRDFLSKYEQKFTRLQEIKARLSKIGHLQEKLSCLKQNRSEVQNQLSQVRKKISSIDVCPACLRPMDQGS